MTWRNTRLGIVLGITLYGGFFNAGADTIVRELGREDGEPKPYVVPYAFASEAMGFVVGAAGGIGGLPQQQNSFFGTALVSDEGAAEWDFDELHDSMKSDIGPSLRIMANNDIGRLDLVWSEDDVAT